jgi:hypothetical protein
MDREFISLKIFLAKLHEWARMRFTSVFSDVGGYLRTQNWSFPTQTLDRRWYGVSMLGQVRQTA